MRPDQHASTNFFLFFHRKTGENGSEIWLSIIGDVFDVTTGEDFYGKGRSYGAFAGRDASVPFVTGVFTAEEAQKSADVISMKELGGLLEWHTFYETHKEYSFVGRLIDPRYYDEKGQPTPDLESLQGRLETVKAEQEAKRKKKKR